MATSKFTNVDDYISVQPPALQPILHKVRQLIRKALPKAEEVISYQMPAYRLPGGTGMIIYFAAWKEHYSIYPATGKPLDAIADELAPYKASKGTLKFAIQDPVPAKLITKVAKLRLQDALDHDAARGRKATSNKPARKAHKS